VISPGSATAVREIDGGVVVELKLHSRRPVRDFEFLLKARRWLRQRPMGGVLHAHGAPFAGRSLGKYFSATVHTVDFFEYRTTRTRLGHRVYATALASYDMNLPVSRFCQKEYEAYYPSQRGRTSVVYNGVNPQKFSQTTEVEGPPGVSGPEGFVLYVGRVCEQKGSDLLGPIAAKLAASHSGLSVVAVGPLGQFGRSGDASGEFGPNGSLVRYLGAVTDEILVPLMQNAAVFVLPTRRYEMFGMVALESIAAGTPVVASDLGGIPEAVGTCGRLVAVGDVDAFVSEISALALHESAKRAVMTGAASHVNALSWASVADAYQRRYLEVLDGRAR
jgi:glycosyltransferase involved in cell wall biosynthesis